MKNHDPFVYAILALTLVCAGCATSPEAQERTRATEEEIESILSQPLDAAEYGETKRCLAGSDYRDFRVLDDQRILFEGRRGRSGAWCANARHVTGSRVQATEGSDYN
jgi:hypothetical protein